MGSAQPNFPPIRACIFDMDGLLIDSEDIYTNCVNIVLKENGKPMLPWNIKAQLQGRPGRQAYEIFAKWAQLPLTESEYFDRQKALHQQYFPSCQPLPGIPSLISTLANAGVYIALATSTHQRNYELKTSHLQSLFSQFPDSQRVLGDDPRIKPGRGKPAPDIFLLALETINEGIRQRGAKEVKVEECLVFEDSVPGIEAGRRAGMRVVWCPHQGLRGEFRGKEDRVLAGRGEEREEEEEKVIGHEEGLDGGLRGWPSRIGDGWGVQMDNLEEFPYSRYGIKTGGKEALDR